MGFAVSLILTAVGLVLGLAVHPRDSGAVNVNTVGWILVAIGIIGFLLDLLLWSEWGPAYVRRAPAAGPSAPGPRWYRYPRRTIVEDEEVTGPGPGY
jgi:hypothetical protein